MSEEKKVGKKLWPGWYVTMPHRFESFPWSRIKGTLCATIPIRLLTRIPGSEAKGMPKYVIYVPIWGGGPEHRAISLSEDHWDCAIQIAYRVKED